MRLLGILQIRNPFEECQMVCKVSSYDICLMVFIFQRGLTTEGYGTLASFAKSVLSWMSVETARIFLRAESFSYASAGPFQAWNRHIWPSGELLPEDTWFLWAAISTVGQKCSMNTLLTPFWYALHRLISSWCKFLSTMRPGHTWGRAPRSWITAFSDCWGGVVCMIVDVAFDLH